MTPASHDLTRTVLAVATIAGLIALSLWVLRPFLGAGIWAAMLVVATWPAFRRLEAALGGRRKLAVGLMSLAMLLLLVVPLWAAIDTLVEHSGRVAGWVRTLAERGLPPPPEGVAELPLVGERVAALWRDQVAGGASQLVGKLVPHAGGFGKWLMGEARTIGMLLVEFLLVVVLAAILYANGEAAASQALRLGRRLAGERGAHVVALAGQAIRAVALGVGVTAIVQTVLGGLGLVLTGVPFAGFLSALMLMLCIAQIGPSLVLFPAVAWMYWQGHSAAATVLLVLSLLVAGLDNVLRPYLIKQGADLPLLLIFAGVIGGLLSFGLIGIFLGPVALAVTYTLMQAWVADGLGAEPGEEAAAVGASAPAGGPPP